MYNFRETEADILKFWRENGIFEKSLALRQAQGKKHFVFFEGPPTANGLPHIGHFLTRVYKDLYGRYKTMRGFFVLRKAGWDTHGLPVEIEIEKELGFKTKKDIENYGIAKFNRKARESAWKYKKEWEEMTRKMGFWLDMKNPYITYENDYIETLWYIIQQIWKKKLLYLAHKVVPFCARCGTSLSSHEVAQGYKTMTDKSVMVKFKIQNSKLQKDSVFRIYNSELFILVWTTTPWTLPGNVALAVGPKITYAIFRTINNELGIENKKSKNQNSKFKIHNSELYVAAKDLLPKITDNYEIIQELLSDQLVGLEYEPLFDIKELKSGVSYKIYEADFVSTQEGTGVVHVAPMYGEDDYNLGTKFGLPKFHTVDETGKFINVGKDFDTMTVKHKDKPTEEKTIRRIVDYLKDKKLIFKEEEYEHEYPFCWRCHSPLLYYAKSSWFIKMSAVREDLLKNNEKVNWFPEHIKEGRFGQWLKEGKDWAFSRERYWGTPLPVWKCQKCDSHKVVGSVEELEKSASSTVAKKNNYFTLRHGYTTRDERSQMIISSDIKVDKYHLTEEGRGQIEKSAQFLKNNHEIDLIYSSPFMRTTESAEITAKILHLNINHDDRLREISHGDCEGKSHSTCPFYDRKQSMDDKHHETGESWNDVRKRMFDFINSMESGHSGKNILIVSHGDPIWLLNNIAEGATGEEILAETDDGREKYPNLGEAKKLDWKFLPRNEYGELDLHRPFIDSITLKCDECGAVMKKVPDLIDVWFDSGAMPFAQWHWPFQIKNLGQEDGKRIFKEQFPADFIVEAVDQTRGWFYTLLAVSTLLGKGAPYKNVMVLGHTLDERGKKMSKSIGNVIRPSELMDLAGVDATRWYFYTANTLGESMVVSQKGAQEKLRGFIFTLQNCVRFYELYDQRPTTNPEQQQAPYNNKLYTGQAVYGAGDQRQKTKNLLDEWILSKLNGLVQEVTEKLDSYDPTTASRAIEKFVVEDLSNWWLRRSRKRKEALEFLRFLLLELAKIIAPFTPFLAEDIHIRMRKGNNIGTESVHLHDWPKANKKLINKKLEEEMEEVRNIVTAGLALRKEKQIKVRQPLASLKLKIKNEKLKINRELEILIKEELNVKEVIYDVNQEDNIIFDTQLTPALINEGYARELIRQIQDMRKEAKYRLDGKVFGQWHSDDKELSEAIHEWTEEIKKEALLEKFIAGPHDKKVYDVEKEFNLALQKTIWVGIKK